MPNIEMCIIHQNYINSNKMKMKMKMKKKEYLVVVKSRGIEEMRVREIVVVFAHANGCLRFAAFCFRFFFCLAMRLH